MPTDRSEDDKRGALRQHATLNPRPNAVSLALFQHSDFFDANDLLQVKYEMLRLARVENLSVSEAAKACGFSRPSFYQARSAFEQGGIAGLIPQRPGPRAGHKLTPTVMQLLSQARSTEPSIRSEGLARLVKRNFGIKVHPRSIERQFLRQKKLR